MKGFMVFKVVYEKYSQTESTMYAFYFELKITTQSHSCYNLYCNNIIVRLLDCFKVFEFKTTLLTY